MAAPQPLRLTTQRPQTSVVIYLNHFRCPARGLARPTVPTAPAPQAHRILVRSAAASGGSRRYREEDTVVFDGEDDWDDEGSTLPARPILQQAFRAVGLVADRLTDVALQFAPEDASPQVVRTAVSGGLVLLAFSFVKGVLSFVLMIGTVVLGAYVAVRVFGLDISGSSRSGRGSRGGGRGREAARKKGGRPSRVAGLLGALTSDTEEDDGLLDVWFERKPVKKSK